MRLPPLLFLLALPATVPASAQSDADLLEAARSFPAMPREPADLFGAFVPPADYTFASGTPYNDLEYTVFSTSYVDGETDGYDVFLPVAPADALPGTGAVHLIRGTSNLDLATGYAGPTGARIILGDDQPFFLQGPDGVDDDYAVVQNVDFRAPFLELSGQEGDYRLLYAAASDGVQTEGHYLFYTAGGTPDLVAFVWPCDRPGLAVSGAEPRDPDALCNAAQRLSLTEGVHVRYARPLDSAPMLPEGRAQVGSAGKEIVGGVAADATGNVYVLGASDGPIEGSPGENVAFVAQVRPDGSRGWTTTVPARDGTLLFDAAADAQHLYVGGRTLGALPGFTNQGRWDAILLKLDLATGAVVAADQYGQAGIDGYGNVVLDEGGALYVSGAGSPAGVQGTDPDYLVAKHDAATLANTWRVTEAPESDGPIFVSEAWGGLSVAPAADGRPARLLAGGWYMTAGGSAGFLSLYEDLDAAQPTRVATATLDSDGTEADWVLGNAIGPDGALYAAGYTTGNLAGSPRGDGDAYLARFSPDLTDPVFVQTGTAQSDLFRTLDVGADGTLYATGYTYGDLAPPNADPDRRSGDVLVQAFTPDLAVLATAQFGTEGEDRGFGALVDGRLFVAGMTEGALVAPGAGSFDGYAAELDPATLAPVPPTTVSAEPGPTSEVGLVVFPNPASGPASVRLSLPAAGEVQVRVFDVLGRERLTLHDGPLDAGAHTLPLDAGRLAPGLYVLAVRSASGVQTQRFTAVR